MRMKTYVYEKRESQKYTPTDNTLNNTICYSIHLRVLAVKRFLCKKIFG